ncbi:MAG TPA: hypothetical protein VNT01_03110 [Symbiobacteriaceae bacterium]|nr:hypothetical protein [Symbiobacteriaceae bacterium]
MHNEKTRILERLRELRSEHAAALGEGSGAAALGLAEDELLTRKSYRLVLEDALDAGVLSEADLHAAGLPPKLE